jgi:hypothetical protein
MSLFDDFEGFNADPAKLAEAFAGLLKLFIAVASNKWFWIIGFILFLCGGAFLQSALLGIGLLLGIAAVWVGVLLAKRGL